MRLTYVTLQDPELPGNGNKEREGCRGAPENLWGWVMEMFGILIVVKALFVHAYVKTHEIVSYHVMFIAYKQCLKRVAKIS